MAMIGNVILLSEDKCHYLGFCVDLTDLGIPKFRKNKIHRKCTWADLRSTKTIFVECTVIDQRFPEDNGKQETA
jgi:hypothetical protein